MEITLESIFQLFAESEKQRKEARLQYEAQRLEQEAQRKQEQLERDEQRDKQREQAEIERKQAEIERKKDMDRYLKKTIGDLSKKIADLGDVLGMYAEAQVKERIKEMFAERGIVCDTLTIHYEYEEANGQCVYEIDLLLYNTIFAIAIEVKHKLKTQHIDEHTERMEKCINYPPRGTEGKILLGAIATMISSPETEAYAQKKGFYLIKPSGKSVKIANPLDFKAKYWHTKGK